VKLRNTILLFIVLIVGFAMVLFFVPAYKLPYVNFALLLIASIYIWSAVKARIQLQKKPIRYILSGLFWLPLVIVVIASFSIIFYSLEQWPDFLRIYFIGGLFAYIFSLLFPLSFLFIADIIRWIQVLFSSKKKGNSRVDDLHGEPITRKKFIVNTGLSLGGLALGTMGFGMVHGNYNFKIWHHQLKKDQLPAALKGLKIVQISDMHLGTWVSKTPLEEVVGYINSLEADMVFFTGDLVNYRTKEAIPFKETLRQIHAKYGVFASLGNHDYGHYYHWESKEDENENWASLLAFYKDLGWKLMRNQQETIKIGDAFVQIIGVENWSLNPRFPRLGDLDTALAESSDADVRLLLSHDPTHWDEKVIKYPIPIDVTFSGHTHGFQFGIESSFFRWSPAQYVYKRWAGMYYNEDRKMFLNVNRGIGAIGFPGRVGIRPEITLVEMV
jgi:predicted MPP superfamily phosphohydrolase